MLAAVPSRTYHVCAAQGRSAAAVSFALAVCLHVAVLAGLSLFRQPSPSSAEPPNMTLEVVTLLEAEPLPPVSFPTQTAAALSAEPTPPPVPAEAEPPLPAMATNPPLPDQVASPEPAPVEAPALPDNPVPTVVPPAPEDPAPAVELPPVEEATIFQAELPTTPPPRPRPPPRPVARPAAPRHVQAEPGERAMPSATPALNAIPVQPPPARGGDQEAAFEARVRDAVRAAVRYPPAARMMGLTGRARLELVYWAGVASNVTLARSAGAPMLDEAAIIAARTAHYPLAPPEIGEQVRRFLVWVEFRSG